MTTLLNHYHILVDKPLFWLYIVAVLVDIFTGNIKAWSLNDVDSNVGVRGTLKHMALFAFVIIFLPTLSVYMGDDTVSQTLMGYFTYQYIISIIENLGVLGFDFPEGVSKHFRRLKDDGDHRGSDS